MHFMVDALQLPLLFAKLKPIMKSNEVNIFELSLMLFVSIQLMNWMIFGAPVKAVECICLYRSV